jgi:hypothetical protein
LPDLAQGISVERFEREIQTAIHPEIASDA